MKHKKINGDVLGTNFKYLRKPMCLEMTQTLGHFE